MPFIKKKEAKQRYKETKENFLKAETEVPPFRNLLLYFNILSIFSFLFITFLSDIVSFFKNMYYLAQSFLIHIPYSIFNPKQKYGGKKHKMGEKDLCLKYKKRKFDLQIFELTSSFMRKDKARSKGNTKKIPGTI